jgi:hypothetical protein
MKRMLACHWYATSNRYQGVAGGLHPVTLAHTPRFLPWANLQRAHRRSNRMRWILWLLTGAAIMIAIVLAAALLGLARLNPWLARRLARSSAAASLLGLLCDVAFLSLTSKRDGATGVSDTAHRRTTGCNRR